MAPARLFHVRRVDLGILYLSVETVDRRDCSSCTGDQASAVGILVPRSRATVAHADRVPRNGLVYAGDSRSSPGAVLDRVGPDTA